MFQNITLFYLIFVSCFHSPKWWPNYIYFGPVIHGLIAIVDFLIIPTVTICNFASNWILFSQSLYGNYLALNLVISIVVMGWAPFTLTHAIKHILETIAIQK